MQKIIEVNTGEETTFSVGKFSFQTDEKYVLVHNNAKPLPVYIRTVSYSHPDEAYAGALRMAYLQSRA